MTSIAALVYRYRRALLDCEERGQGLVGGGGGVDQCHQHSLRGAERGQRQSEGIYLMRCLPVCVDDDRYLGMVPTHERQMGLQMSAQDDRHLVTMGAKPVQVPGQQWFAFQREQPLGMPHSGGTPCTEDDADCILRGYFAAVCYYRRSSDGGVLRLWIYSAVVLANLYTTQVLAAPAIGISAAGVSDRQDPLSGATGGGGGWAVEVPVLFEVSRLASVKVALGHMRADTADRLTWREVINGEKIRFYEDGRALISQSKLSLGLEIALPLKHLEPTFGVAIGGAVISAGEYGDTFTNTTLSAIESVESTPPGFALLTEAHLGLRRSISSQVALYLQTGYSVATVAETSITTSNPDLDLMRERIGLNAVHLGIGVLLRPSP